MGGPFLSGPWPNVEPMTSLLCLSLLIFEMGGAAAMGVVLETLGDSSGCFLQHLAGVCVFACCYQLLLSK